MASLLSMANSPSLAILKKTRKAELLLKILWVKGQGLVQLTPSNQGTTSYQAVLVIMMVISALASLTIAREWKQGTMKTLISTPVKGHELGKLLSILIIGMTDVGTMLMRGLFMSGALLCQAAKPWNPDRYNYQKNQFARTR